MIHNKNVLITGGAGFIGSHLAERLAERNDVTVLDDFSTGSRSNVSDARSIKIVDGDVTDEALVRRIAHGTDVVLHMAAMMGVKRTLEHPLDVLAVNIDGTRSVLDAAVAADVDRVLMASTSEIYGDATDPPYAESDEASPKTNYAVAKLADERFVQAYGTEYDLDYTIVRYFNVYGPRQDPSGYGYVVPIFVKQALADETIEVHGDGSQTRDFTYIDDAIDCTLRSLSPRGRNEVFNVGTGHELSVRELAERVVSVVGSGTVEEIDHPRPYEVDRRCANVSKVNRLLGYEPQYSIAQGIETLAETGSKPLEAEHTGNL